MNGSKKETMGVVGDSQVLAYPSLEPLSGVTNVSGVTATTRKFINNTRPEVVGQGILKEPTVNGLVRKVENGAGDKISLKWR